MAQKTALTFNENGRAITETVEGIEMPSCGLESLKEMTSAERTALNKFNKAISTAGEINNLAI